MTPAAGRTLGSERHQRADREVAFGENVEHGFTDRAGGTDDGDSETAAGKEGLFWLVEVLLEKE